MASNSYYNDGQQSQQSVGYDQNASYGASYGQGNGQDNYGAQNYGGYGAQAAGGQGGQTFADQTYTNGSREQQYDAQGNPVLPNGERGLLTDLAGAAGGAFLGHKAGGHGFLGAIAGGIGAHLLGDAMKPKHNAYGRPQQGGLGGMFGRRDIDGSTDPGQDQYGASQGPQGGYGQIGNQDPYQNQGQQGGYDQNQAYGQNYGQNYGR